MAPGVACIGIAALTAHAIGIEPEACRPPIALHIVTTPAKRNDRAVRRDSRASQCVHVALRRGERVSKRVRAAIRLDKQTRIKARPCRNLTRRTRFNVRSWLYQTRRTRFTARSCRLRALRGFDVDRGLTLLRGQKSRYIQLLHKMCSAHRRDGQLLAEYLQRGEVEAARRLAHDLKGMTGSVGAEQLSVLAARLDGLLRDGRASAAECRQVAEAIDSEFVALSAALAALAPVLDGH
jgi:HPt (histidine-containing phosphotransfer) domain-containing protein